MSITAILEALKNLLNSKTIWGLVILVANHFFGASLDEAATDAVTQSFNQLFTAIGGILVFIGRLTAKPISTQTILPALHKAPQ